MNLIRFRRWLGKCIGDTGTGVQVPHRFVMNMYCCWMVIMCEIRNLVKNSVLYPGNKRITFNLQVPRGGVHVCTVVM